MVSGRRKYERSHKRKRPEISTQDKEQQLSSLVEALLKTPVSEWSSIEISLVFAIENATDLLGVVSKLGLDDRKQFLDLFLLNHLWQFIFVNKDSGISIPVLGLLPKIQWSAFLNSCLSIGIANMDQLLLLAEDPVPNSVYCSYKNDFLLLLNETNIQRYIQNAANLIAFLKSFPKEQQPQIINKIGPEKIRSIIRNKDDFLSLFKLSKYDVCINMLDQDFVCKVIESELANLLSGVPQPFHCRLFLILDHNLLLKFLPDHLQLKAVLEHLSKQDQDAFLNDLISKAMPNNTLSLKRFSADSKIYSLILINMLEFYKRQLIDMNRLHATPDITSLINRFIKAVKSLDTNEIDQLDVDLCNSNGKIASIYHDFIKPFLQEHRKAEDMKRPIASV